MIMILTTGVEIGESYHMEIKVENEWKNVLQIKWILCWINCLKILLPNDPLSVAVTVSGSEPENLDLDRACQLVNGSRANYNCG